jgi:hypothetical protein
MKQGLIFRVEGKWGGKKKIKQDKKESWMMERG